MVISGSDYIAIAALILTIAGFMINYFAVIAGMKERLATLETKMELFWRAIENNVIHLLKSYPTHIRKDILLDKLSCRALNLEEAYELRTILREEMKGLLNNTNTIAYVLMIARLEQRIYEMGNKKKESLWKRLF